LEREKSTAALKNRELAKTRRFSANSMDECAVERAGRSGFDAGCQRQFPLKWPPQFTDLAESK